MSAHYDGRLHWREPCSTQPACGRSLSKMKPGQLLTGNRGGHVTCANCRAAYWDWSREQLERLKPKEAERYEGIKLLN
jgi:hypothetical protein